MGCVGSEVRARAAPSFGTRASNSSLEPEPQDNIRANEPPKRKRLITGASRRGKRLKQCCVKTAASVIDSGFLAQEYARPAANRRSELMGPTLSMRELSRISKTPAEVDDR